MSGRRVRYLRATLLGPKEAASPDVMVHPLGRLPRSWLQVRGPVPDRGCGEGRLQPARLSQARVHVDLSGGRASPLN